MSSLLLRRTMNRSLNRTSFEKIATIGQTITRNSNIIIQSSSFSSSFSAPQTIDLRSDTVTKPSAGMLDAMRAAKVGDDVYCEDPTVIELEQRVADLAGMEAGLFVPSGTMGNLIGLGMHCQRGEEILCGDRSHIFYYEGGGASVHMGLAFHPVKNEIDGTIAIETLQNALRPSDILFAPTRLVAVENTHNFTGGRALTVEYMTKVASFAAKNNLILHVDGARIFNTAVAQGVTIRDLLPGTHSASICISKGLGCSVGSVLVGSSDKIAHARRLRKTLGGGMRQVGYLAAAGLYALEHNVSRLHEDHLNAQQLAKALDANPNIDVVTKVPDTNIVIFGFKNNSAHVARNVVSTLKAEHGILMNAMANNRIRAVTHLDVNSKDIQRAAEVINGLVR